MKDPLGSIYPAFLETGLAKLHDLGVHRELLALFAALENFRRDLHASEDVPDILAVTCDYVQGLRLFHTVGVYLVNPADLSFELALCNEPAERARLESLVGREIQSGRFAWALRQPGPVFFHGNAPASGERGVFHVMTLANQVVGMFCGLLRQEGLSIQEISFSLLSILLGASSDALAAVRKTTQLRNEINTLTGLLPICAWCKRVRGDQGYWEQLESFVQSRSGAAFSHGICPDCRAAHFGETEGRS